MKKLIILSLAVLPFLSSCRKDLNEDPFNSIPEKDAFSTADRIDKEAVGMYDALQNSNFFGGRILIYADIRGIDATPATYFGLDTRNSSIENWNGTRTGYSIRKFSNDNPAIVDMNQKQEVPSIQIRYTEVVFNYIEALLALGDEATATTWLNKIRFRAGMPAITETGAALVDHYRNERNIEMVCEEQRFYDCRRWMIAPTTLGNKVRIMLVTGKLKAGQSAAIYRYDKTKYDYTYTVQNIESGVENRKWDDKVYFPPIRLDEMNKNSKLIQNPGY